LLKFDLEVNKSLKIMLLNKYSILFILSVIVISNADILQILSGASTTTRRPTIFPKCFLNYAGLDNNYTEFGSKL
jgi:hypothetical protein